MVDFTTIGAQRLSWQVPHLAIAKQAIDKSQKRLHFTPASPSELIAVSSNYDNHLKVSPMNAACIRPTGRQVERKKIRPIEQCVRANVSLGALPAFVMASVILLAGCSKQLLGALDETTANQVVSTLRLEGVVADKSSAGEKAWRVTVPDDQFADAVQILERRNLPSQQFQGLGQVFKKESLVSTPTEERARLMYAMSQELERSLVEIDGVLVARVHPVILPHDPLNPKRNTATASVLIKYRAGVDVSGRESMVRSLVAAGIEGLNYDDVRVVMVPAETHLAALGKSGGGLPSGTPTHAEGVARWHIPPLYAGVLATMLAGLALTFAWTHWRRQVARAATNLRGRWDNTINGVFNEHDHQPDIVRGRRPDGLS